MQHPDLVALDPLQCRGAWELYRTHPAVMSCVQTIRNFVLGSCMQFNEKNCNIMIKQAYDRLAKHALEWLVCIGVVPITFRTVGENKILLPVVPVPESVDIFVRVTPTGEKVYEAVYKRKIHLMGPLGGAAVHLPGNCESHSDITRVFVWSSGIYSPTCDGKLVTALTHLQGSEEFVNFMKRKAMVAEQIRSNPPLVTHNRSIRNDDRAGVWNQFHGKSEDALEEHAREMVDRLEGVDCEQHNLHAEWCKSVVPPPGDQTTEFIAKCQPFEHYITHDRDLTRQVTAEPPQNLPDYIRWSEEKIYMLFGLPYSVFSNSGASVQANSLQQLSLNQTMTQHATTIEQFLNDAFNLSMAVQRENALSEEVVDADGDPHRFVVNTTSEPHKIETTGHKRSRSSDGESQGRTAPKSGFALQKNTRDNENRTQFVTLRPSTCVGPVDVTTLYTNGIITDIEARRLLMASHQLPEQREGKLIYEVQQQALVNVNKSTQPNQAVRATVKHQDGQTKDVSPPPNTGSIRASK